MPLVLKSLKNLVKRKMAKGSYTYKADKAKDRAKGIKEGSKRDKAIDKKKGLKS